MRAECNSATYVFRFALHIEPAPTGTCGYDYGRSREYLAALYRDFLLLAKQGGALDATVLEQFYGGVVGKMGAQVVGQFATRGVGYGYQILYTHGVLHLSANSLCHHGHLQSLACRVYGRRCTGRASTKYNDIEMSV